MDWSRYFAFNAQYGFLFNLFFFAGSNVVRIYFSLFFNFVFKIVNLQTLHQSGRSRVTYYLVTWVRYNIHLISDFVALFVVVAAAVQVSLMLLCFKYSQFPFPCY